MDKKRAIQTLAIAVTLIAFAGCQPSAQNQGTTGETASSTSSNATAGATSVPEGSSSTPPVLTHRPNTSSPSAPVLQVLTAPARTTIQVRLASEISSATASSGMSFQGSLAEPLIVRGVTVAPRGSLVNGQITNAVSSGRLKRPAELSLVLTSISPEGGQATPISTYTWSESGKSHKKRDVTMIGGGAGLGAVVGAIAGGGKGAAIGGLVGAAAGTGGAYATGKKEIVLPAETQLTFRLNAAASFTVQQ